MFRVAPVRQSLLLTCGAALGAAFGGIEWSEPQKLELFDDSGRVRCRIGLLGGAQEDFGFEILGVDGGVGLGASFDGSTARIRAGCPGKPGSYFRVECGEEGVRIGCGDEGDVFLTMGVSGDGRPFVVGIDDTKATGFALGGVSEGDASGRLVLRSDTGGGKASKVVLAAEDGAAVAEVQSGVGHGIALHSVAQAGDRCVIGSDKEGVYLQSAAGGALLDVRNEKATVRLQVAETGAGLKVVPEGHHAVVRIGIDSKGQVVSEPPK